MAKRRLALALPALLTLGWSFTAFAKPEFPSEIEGKYMLHYHVPCSVCHVDGNTGSSTARTPFALSLRQRGLTGDNKSVSSALDSADTDGVDSDGDGVSDVNEVKAGTDPNTSGNARIDQDQEPGYGCGGTAPQGRSAGQAVVGALGLAWLLHQRRRARS
jgi:hypothetical protein